MKERIDWVDAAKGGGILLVVLGHNPGLKIDAMQWIHTAIYLFHMPLFFMLSGMLNGEVFNSKTLPKKARALLLPYIFCCVLFAGWRFYNEGISISSLAQSSLLFYGDTPPQPQLWFLPTLFIIFLLFNAPPFRNEVGRLVFLGIAVALLFANEAELFPRTFNLDLIAVCSFFYCIGFLLRNRLGEAVRGVNAGGLALCLLVFMGSQIIVFFTPTPISLDINLRMLEGRFTLLASALLAVCFIIFVSRAPEPLSRLLRFFGQRSLVIFCFHYVIQSKAYRVIIDMGGNPYFVFALSFAIAIFFCVVIDAVVRRSASLTYVFYGPRV